MINLKDTEKMSKQDRYHPKLLPVVRLMGRIAEYGAKN